MGYTQALADKTAQDIAFIREAVDILGSRSIDLDARPHLRPLLVPHSRYSELSPVELIRDIAEERMRLSAQSIDRHIDLAEAGKERVKYLCRHFNLYAHWVLGGKTRSVTMDIRQQALDVSIMFVYNHTRGLLMRKLVPDDDPVLNECLRRIELQRLALSEFQKETQLPPDSFEGDGSGPISPASLVEFQDGFEYRTLDVANKNMDVCESAVLLLKNGVRGMHYWRKMLESEFNGMALAQELGFYPDEDLRFEVDILRLNDQKVGILNDRAAKICDLGGRVAELDFM